MILYKAHLTLLLHYIAYSRLTCQCSENAKANDYPYFALRYWGICVGVKNYNASNDIGKISADCFNGEFKKCSNDDTEECVGTTRTDFIYKVGETLLNID